MSLHKVQSDISALNNYLGTADEHKGKLIFPPKRSGIKRYLYCNVFSLEYNWFIMLGSCVLYNDVNQLYIYIYAFPLEPPSCSRRAGASLLHRARSWAPRTIQQLPTGCLFNMWECTHVSTALPAHPLPVPLLCPQSILYVWSLFQPCRLVHRYHFCRSHIYALIYDMCFSLSGLLSTTNFRFNHLTTGDPTSFSLWLSNIPLHKCTMCALSTHLLMDI